MGADGGVPTAAGIESTGGERASEMLREKWFYAVGFRVVRRG